jgi:Uma2 family endonuclease
MVATTVKLTLAEYLTYEDGTDNRYELVDGELVLMPPPTHLHRRIAQLLERLFQAEIQRSNHQWETGRGDIGVNIQHSYRNIARIPDVVVFVGEAFRNENRTDIDTMTDVAILTAPPRLVVEVVSLGEANRKRDYEQKPREYQRMGIPEYWIVDPERQVVTTLILCDGLYAETEYHDAEPITCQTFPELSLTATQLF